MNEYMQHCQLWSQVMKKASLPFIFLLFFFLSCALSSFVYLSVCVCMSSLHDHGWIAVSDGENEFMQHCQLWSQMMKKAKKKQRDSDGPPAVSKREARRERERVRREMDE